MRVVLFALLLSIVQAAPPIPRQTTDSPAKTEAVGNKQRNEDAEHSVVVSKLPPVTVASPKRDWADWGTWGFNGLLVVVGFLQVVLLCWTFRLMRHQAQEMTRQRIVMAGQLSTMQEQLAQMQSSGKQTDSLIEQATATAVAAKASADAAIAAERAWVMVSLEKVPITGSLLMYGRSWKQGEEVHNASVRVRCICINQGKTPAKIIEKRATVVRITEADPLPNTPNLDIEIQDPVPYPLQGYPGPGQIVDWRLDTEYKIPEGERDMTSFFVVYGVVKYQHFFSEQVVQTTFGYKIRLDSILERLIEHPEYNKNT